MRFKLLDAASVAPLRAMEATLEGDEDERPQLNLPYPSNHRFHFCLVTVAIRPIGTPIVLRACLSLLHQQEKEEEASGTSCMRC